MNIEAFLFVVRQAWRVERWSPSLGQVGGEVKVDRHGGYAARESAGPAYRKPDKPIGFQRPFV